MTNREILQQIYKFKDFGAKKLKFVITNDLYGVQYEGNQYRFYKNKLDEVADPKEVPKLIQLMKFLVEDTGQDFDLMELVMEYTYDCMYFAYTRPESREVVDD